MKGKMSTNTGSKNRRTKGTCSKVSKRHLARDEQAGTRKMPKKKAPGVKR